MIDDATKQKLANLVAKKKQIDERLVNDERRKRLRAEEETKKRKQTDEYWPKAVSDIKAAIDSVNASIDESDMHFETGAFDPPRDKASYGRLPISLRHEDGLARTIYLNISDVGTVNAVFLVPSSGKNPHSFDLMNVSEDFYIAMLTDFLSQVVEQLERSTRERQ